MITKTTTATDFSISLLYVSDIQTTIQKTADSQLPPANFDDRTDLIIGGDFTGVGVMVHVINERHIADCQASGIRRSLSALLIDECTGTVVGSTEIKVNIPSGQLSGFFNGRIALPPDAIDPDYGYKVIIREKSSGAILRERRIRFFDMAVIGDDSSRWYKVIYGSIMDRIDESYRSFENQMFECYRVRFKVSPSVVSDISRLPQPEIRIVYPDGEIENRFCTPVCDDYDPDEYYVEMPFMMFGKRVGVCYAELVVSDNAVAGFVFSTNGPTLEGLWTGNELEPIDEYSTTSITDRFRSLVMDNDECFKTKEASDSDADEFELALERFIGLQKADFNDEEESVSEKEPDTETEQFADCLSALDHLTGLENVKTKVKAYESIVRFNKMRADQGLKTTEQPLHAMFLGSPGTGKTTVAKVMGEMLHKAGILSKGHVVIRERSNLIGTTYGSEEANTLKAIEDADGGILFIDEAYQLYQPNDSRDPGKFVIEALMIALSDDSRRDWMLILAGYPDKMLRMFEMNPGLRSRIPLSNDYIFDDFSVDQLMEIALNYFDRHQFSLTDEAHEALRIRLADDYAQRDETFGNARHVINLIQTDILPAMAERVIKTECTVDEVVLSKIHAADIPHVIKPNIISRRKLGFCA